LIDAALLWVRRPWSYVYGSAIFAALLTGAVLAGFDTWTSRFGLAAIGASIAVVATTDYRILALTTDDLVMCRAGRLRQVARSIIDRPPMATEMFPIGGTMLTAEWKIGKVTYTVTKSSQQSLARISASASRNCED